MKNHYLSFGKAFVCGELIDDSYKQGRSTDADDCVACVAIVEVSGSRDN